jgi:hypothetical protein
VGKESEEREEDVVVPVVDLVEIVHQSYYIMKSASKLALPKVIHRSYTDTVSTIAMISKGNVN